VPEELDAGIVGQYRFPDPRRRRIAGWIYLGTAVVLAGLASQQSLVWGGVALAALLGVWHLVSAWPLVMDQEQALAKAATVVDFPVGHSSAAVTFVGVRSRPRWHVVMYSADEPPSQRALVQFDGVNGDLAEDVYTEDVPTVDEVS
jgi:hypothetical protein